MRNGLQSAYDYCQSLTKREAKNFYYGFMLLPNGPRSAIYAAYAFARQCGDIVGECLARTLIKLRVDRPAPAGLR